MLPHGLDSNVTKLLANLLTKPSLFYYFINCILYFCFNNIIINYSEKPHDCYIIKWDSPIWLLKELYLENKLNIFLIIQIMYK